MIITLATVDRPTLQQILNNQFGPGVFNVLKTQVSGSLTFELEFNDSVPNDQVDQALVYVQQSVDSLLNQTKVRLYDDLQTMANKLITQKSRPHWSEQDVVAATNWLSNQSGPVPDCVAYNSLRENIDSVTSAQQIRDSESVYQTYIANINAILASGQSAILASSEFSACKSTGAMYMEQLKSLQ